MTVKKLDLNKQIFSAQHLAGEMETQDMTMSLFRAVSAQFFKPFSIFDFWNQQVRPPQSLHLPTQNPLTSLYFYPLMSNTPRRTKNDIDIEDNYWHNYLVSTLGYTAEFTNRCLS